MVLANQALNLSKRDADVAIRATDNPPETLVGRRVATHRLGGLRPRRRFPEPGDVDLAERSTSAPGSRSATISRP